MSSIHDRVRGHFVSAVKDLIIAAPVEPRQIAAATHPAVSTRALLDQRKPLRRARLRRITDLQSKRGTRPL